MAVRRFINHSIYLLFVLLISSVLTGCSPSKPSDETISAAQKGDDQAQYEYGMYLWELADEADCDAPPKLFMAATGTSEFAFKMSAGAYDEARKWLEKAGDQGHPDALYQLGIMYHRLAQEYRPDSYSVEDELYRKSAEYFHKSVATRAWWRLGNCYLFGKGEKRSLFKAACCYTGFVFWLGVDILLLPFGIILNILLFPFKIIGYIYHLIF